MSATLIPDLSAVILCGGQGSRLGGADKGLYLFQGQPLVEHLLRQAQPWVQTLCISANRNLPTYASYGYPVYPDQESDYPGPLAGIETALAHCPTPWLLTLPCDTPHLPANLIPRLYQAAVQHGAAYACDPERSHPVIHCVPRTALAALHSYRQAGQRSVKGWLAQIQAQAVLFPDPAAFANLNHGTDLSHGA